MKLITKAVEKKLLGAPMYLTENLRPTDIPVLVKFFDPCGRGAWYVTEAYRCDNGEWEFFGWVSSPLGPDYDELGYFQLYELARVRNKMGLPLERDLYWSGSLADAKGEKA